MNPVDQHWREVIDLSEVPQLPGVFILGSYARKVTIYSQQVRSLNLADALAGMGYLSHATKVAVIGGGFAGVTLAAALSRMGVSGSIFDKNTSPLHLQLNCSTRYLHPHIYDWPFRGINETDAGLPVLNWQADFSNTVARNVKGNWKSSKSENFKESYGVAVKGIEQKGQSWSVKTSVNALGEVFDLVVFTVGFGVEEDNSFSYSYWGDLPLSEDANQGHSWVVSGAGDGALTDIIRLCVRNQDHREVMTGVVAAVEKHSGHDFLNQLKERLLAGMQGSELFDGLEPGIIAGDLQLRGDPVVLNSSIEEVFGQAGKMPRASVLNRCVTWILWKLEKIQFLPGRIDADRITGRRGDLLIPFKDQGLVPIQSAEILLRHGPKSILPNPVDDAYVDDVNDAERLVLTAQQIRSVRRLGRCWADLYASERVDPTLQDSWPEGVFESKRLAPDFDKWPGILVVSKIHASNRQQISALKNGVKSIFRRESIQEQLAAFFPAGSTFDGDLPTLIVEEAVVDARALGFAVQAMCMAPVAIIDATVIGPELAFVLGIRAVVRRGITVLFREGDLNARAWESLPFNLREIRIVETRDRTSRNGFETPIAMALEEGIARFNRHPHLYSDLPGFDALRNLGGDQYDIEPRSGSTEVLVLCPFDEDFEGVCWPEIQRAVHQHFAFGSAGEGSARRVIDLETPETLTRRLFESIRLDTECIVDLTYQKPNVYFELGIRLVAHPDGARLIHCADLNLTVDESSDDPVLGRLLGSRPYRCHDDSQPRASNALGFGRKFEGGVVSAGFAYSVAQRCVDFSQESGGVGVLNLLWNTCSMIGGSDFQTQQRLPVMYSENAKIRRDATRYVFDLLLGYLLLTRSLNPEYRRERRWRIALSDIKVRIDDVEFDPAERAELDQLISELSDTQ